MRQWLKDYTGLLVVLAACVVFVVVLAVLTACQPAPVPPPIIPNPPPVQPISQCTEVFPDGYTRPIKTNHVWLILTAQPGVRVIRWLSRHCDRWVQGPYDPAHPEVACAYRPDLGDRYYSERDGFVAVTPQACPQTA